MLHDPWFVLRYFGVQSCHRQRALSFTYEIELRLSVIVQCQMQDIGCQCELAQSVDLYSRYASLGEKFVKLDDEVPLEFDGFGTKRNFAKHRFSTPQPICTH